MKGEGLVSGGTAYASFGKSLEKGAAGQVLGGARHN